MRILVVTNLYPPHHIGGYELGCRDVVEKLRARGHAVRVLTSTFLTGGTSVVESDVERSLHFTVAASISTPKKRFECEKLDRMAKSFKPDVIYFWNQAGLCRWLPVAARWRGCRTAFFLSDTNFVSWRVGAWLARLASDKGVISKLVQTVFSNTFLVRGWPVIQNQPCHFASNFLRNQAQKSGLRINKENSIVAHWGVDPAQFNVVPRERWPVRRLLYAGQMIPQKGVHTAIAAFALLAKEPGYEALTLTLAGGGQHSDYENKLRTLPGELGIEGRVNFLGKVPRAGLARVYLEHDVLIFPSEWDEPFAITPLEAIASGLAVVGTTTGGSGELFRNRETAMTFCAGDAVDCARAIRELSGDRDLFQALCRNAQREVHEKHSLDAMVAAVEKSLRQLCGSGVLDS